MAKKKEPESKPKVHPELEGFDIEVNSFGEVRVNYDLDKLNEFLDRNVPDKKFKERTDKPFNQKQDTIAEDPESDEEENDIPPETDTHTHADADPETDADHSIPDEQE